ncbi:TPA: HAMP domain-containing histidine kinase [Serratia marcescens]|jgi:two-component system sensor histidine kinase QseC|uniref:sensor histidine kinase n=1 Tax=Comamonas testosteroni TaxID=285 RepID=UPI00056F4C6A|nr:HAMP domain-containing sensor histidine kinase [Comamonas testosteroni]HAU4292631.1 HAMP domain-containing histidine kinase [Serratia marcescens]HDS1520294.1 HAMP domain-containing histidine kinase [Stenotrophomonas maltophilia]WEE78411.1 HAMP domain-containing histidine kinase [Comamonas testosteroni]HAU4297923.1 HAMP domain-containing histidine kinase [Serratia marcescens]HAU4313452.1 HAMP domain-containing histidine kinase [Serratia marcescens]
MVRPDSEALSDASQGGSWSLQRRLAASLVICIGGTFAILFPVLDYWIDHEIYRRMDTTLMQRSAAVGRVLQELDARKLESLMPEYEHGGHTEFFTVFDSQTHRTLLRSPSSAGAELSLGPVEQGTPRYYDVTLPDGHAGRALATRVSVTGERSQLLVVATERRDWDQTERRIHFALLGGIVLATLLATGLALLMVRHIVVMLERVGEQLADLRSDRPIARIGADFPRELRPFAEAFNQGLHHLYAAIVRERRFSRDVAHELRTPLAEIRISAESALIDADPARIQRALNAMIQASSRMQRSVDTLLLLARLESGQHTLALDPLDLTALLQELLAGLNVQKMAPKSPIRVTLPESAWVQSDQGVIERILSNLLRNAIEYAPEGDDIQCRLELEASGWMLTIVNTAPNLQASDLDQFGLRFWRKDSEGGTAHHAGLGLALALALAHAIDLPLAFSLDNGRLSARLGPWPPLL